MRRCRSAPAGSGIGWNELLAPHRRGELGAVAPRSFRDEPRSGGTLSEDLEGWLQGAGEKTLGSLIELFEEKSFAILFVLLLGVPALPVPTGGATHVFEVIAVLLALQLIAGRDQIWLPERWRKRELAGDKQERFLTALMKMIRRLERISKPRLRFCSITASATSSSACW